MANCKDGCKHAILCPTWGEYKCAHFRRHMRPGEKLNCEAYEKGTNSNTECHCETCESRVKDNDN